MMITLISLHNSSLSTEIAITVNQRVNLRLTEDTVTSCTKRHVLSTGAAPTC